MIGLSRWLGSRDGLARWLGSRDGLARWLGSRDGLARWLGIVGLVACACGDASTSGAGGASSATSTSPTSTTEATTTGASASTTASSSGAGGHGGQGPACPAGSTEIANLAACPSAPPPPPAGLVSAVLASARGSVIDLGGLSVPSAPCASARVCRPNDAPTLLFSDEPETTSTDGVLYADTITAGRYRAYVYHVNAASSPRKFPVVVLNQGATAATLTITKKGLAGPMTDYPAAGKQAALAWLASASSTVVTVPPSTRVLLDPGLDALHAGKNELVHAIVDFTTDASVKVSVVSVPASADAAAITAGLSLVPSSGLHVRGTFPGAALAIVGDGAALGGVRSLSLGAGTFDPDLAGHSAVDANQAVTLKGNFGVPWGLSFPLAESAALALSPRGGSWAGGCDLGVGSDGGPGVVALPASSTTLDTGPSAIHLGRFDAGTTARGTLMTGGGSSLPLALLFVPL